MSITRINTFQALDTHIDALKAFLQALLPTIRSAPGCQSCQLLQDPLHPANMVMLEVWDSIDAHHHSLQHVSADSIKQVALLLAAPPVGNYYK
jgi:quinol monooxygenase YgiN